MPVQSPQETPADVEEESQLQIIEGEVALLREKCKLIEKKRHLAGLNANVRRPGDEALKKLDNSVKGNTGLVKKLRFINGDTEELLSSEILKTNQSKYISEVVSAIVEGGCKLKDITSVVQIASLLHQRYDDFGVQLKNFLIQNLLNSCKPDDEDKPNMPKRRFWLRLLAELQVVQIIEEQLAIKDVIDSLARVDFKKDRNGALASLHILTSFAKHFRSIFFTIEAANVSQSIAEGNGNSTEKDKHCDMLDERQMLLQKLYAENNLDFKASPIVQNSIYLSLKHIFEMSSNALMLEHENLETLDLQNTKIINNRGDLPEEMALQYDAQRTSYENLLKTLTSLSEILQEPLPKLDLLKTTKLKSSSKVGVVSLKGLDSQVDGPYDSEELRFLYESLVDISPIIFNDHPKKDDESALEHRVGIDEAVEFQDSLKVAELDELICVDVTQAKSNSATLQEVLDKCAEAKDLSSADDAAQAFININSKTSRKRLVKVLSSSIIGELHQLPYYARIIATLAPAFNDLQLAIVNSVEKEFNQLMMKKDNGARLLEARIHNCKFISELTKFKIFPFGTFFTLFKSLLDDFQEGNIDTAAAMIESAGRYLYLLPETTQRLSNMLEVMMKLKNSRNLDPRKVLAIETAYVSCKPPGRRQLKSKHPLSLMYLKHLILSNWGEEDVPKLTKKIRRFHWDEVEFYLVRKVIAAANESNTRAPALASLCASISKYRPSLSVLLSDELLEEVQYYMEHASLGKYQRRLSSVQLLGELYNYKVVDSWTIFSTLYYLLDFGHKSLDDLMKYDPPNDFFRVRLVCTLLLTCGHYFSKGNAAKQLDRFLLYFQRYLFYKGTKPKDVDFDIQDMFSSLRPNFAKFHSCEDVSEAIQRFDASHGPVSSFGKAVDSDSETDELETLVSTHADDNSEKEQIDRRFASPSDEFPDELVDVNDLNCANNKHVYDEEFEKELADILPDTYQQSNSSLVTHAASPKTVSFKVPANLALVVKSEEMLAQDAAERAVIKRLVLESSEVSLARESDNSTTRQKLMSNNGKLKKVKGRIIH